MLVRQFRLIKLLVCRNLIVSVGKIISLPWFFKELKTTYQRTISFVASSLYFSFANQYSLGGGFPFPIVLVKVIFVSHSYQTWFTCLSGNWCLCVWVAWPRDHEVHITETIRIRSLIDTIQVRSNSNFDVKSAPIQFYGNSHNSQSDRWIKLKFYVESPYILSYLGLKVQVNRSSLRHQNTGQQRLYEFCYLLPFDL